MIIKLNVEVDGKLSNQYTTLTSPNTGKPFDLKFRECQYWANRAIEINKALGGDPDFDVYVRPSRQDQR